MPRLDAAQCQGGDPPSRGLSPPGQAVRALLESPVTVVLVLAASLARFVLELSAIRARCCFDFPAALEAVQSFSAEGNLYTPVLEDYAPGIGAFKYPPPYALLLLPFSRLTTPQWALHAYLAFELMLYAVALGLLASAFGLRGRGGRGWTVVFAVLALNLGPVFETLLRLQIELPILCGLALAARALGKGQERTAGAALAAAAALKIYPGVALFPFLRKRRLGVLTGFVVALAVLSGLSVAVFGRTECARFVVGALPIMLRELPTDLYGAENASVARWLMVQAAFDPALARTVGSALAALLLAVSLLAVKGSGPLGLVTAAELALFVPVALLAMPNSWTNYQLLLLFPMTAVLGWARRRGLRAAALPVSLVLVAALWLTYHMDTYYYPLALHLPPRLSALVHDNRWMVSLVVWVATLMVVVSADAQRAEPGRSRTRTGRSSRSALAE